MKSQNIELMKNFISLPQEEKSRLWNLKTCVICKLKKEPWNDEIYFCEKCSKIYEDLNAK